MGQGRLCYFKLDPDSLSSQGSLAHSGALSTVIIGLCVLIDAIRDDGLSQISITTQAVKNDNHNLKRHSAGHVISEFQNLRLLLVSLPPKLRPPKGCACHSMVHKTLMILFGSQL